MIIERSKLLELRQLWDRVERANKAAQDALEAYEQARLAEIAAWDAYESARISA